MRRWLSPALILCGLLAMIVALKGHLDGLSRYKVPGSSIIYLPSGKYLKAATFGYESLVADIVYLWAIQYYSTPEIPDRFDHLEHIFSLIAELDPKYADPFLVGAVIASYEARNPTLSLRILDRAMAKNPDDWLFPFEAGHYAQMFLKDYELARRYYARAMVLEGAPDIAKRLYANAAFRTGDLETAWETWLEVFQRAPDERIRKIASNHLYQVQATRDIQNLKGAITRFKERFGRLPRELKELVSAGILSALPRDFDGNDYVYNRETGEVATAVIPWKR